MTHDITEYDENKQAYIEDKPIEDASAPPLCLVHYYAERTAYPPERPPQPPGDCLIGRVSERRGNLIILEFAPLPVPKTKRAGKGLPARVYDALVLLLLLACLLGCAAAFRF